MNNLPCNCYHAKEEHKVFNNDDMELDPDFRGWCIYSEYGQCPCDMYTPMDNLAYLEWKDQLRRITNE
jgi:hypothetical protein